MPLLDSKPLDAELTRAIVESGFAKFKDWLDLRLQQQQDELQLQLYKLSKNQSTIASLVPGSANQLPRPPSKEADMVSQAIPLAQSIGQDQSADLAAKPSPDADVLRVAASLGLPSGTGTGYPSDNPREDMILPGAAEDIQSATEIGDNSSRQPPESPRPPADDLPETLRILQCEPRENIDGKPEPLTPGLRTSRLEQDWQSKLMNVFDELDLDRSGSIDRHEFEEAFKEVGLPPVQAFEVFNSMDEGDGNGVIDRVEWLHVIEDAAQGSDEDVGMLLVFIEKLADHQRDKGKLYETDRSKRPFCILRHDSVYRMVWDVLMMILLFYISITLPYSLGFGQSKVLDSIDRVFDMLFCTDVCLNFRTSYADKDDSVIVSGRKIAKKYCCSWFLLDFFSSVPFDMVTAGLMPNLTPARFLKLGKIAKVMKLLRISKMLNVFAKSELAYKLEEKSSSKAHQTAARLGKLVSIAFIVAHWQACVGAIIDNSHLDSYFADGRNDNPSDLQKYLAAVYWAMTTLSTVGFGDIIPVSDQERAFAMFAMVLGGAFYGYIIGSVTSIISDMDRNAREFYDRMDLIQSWLDKHQEIPKLLRRRVRKHFKLTLWAKTAIDDGSVVSELSPELRADMAFFIVHEHVRQNNMFLGIPNSALAQLVQIIQKSYTNKAEFIVRQGDPGIAMYILVEGVARYDKGVEWRPAGCQGEQKRFQQLMPGDSFGEEIVFGQAETYDYDIVAITDCLFHSLSEDGFQDRFRNMPDLHKQMLTSFLSSRRGDGKGVPPVGDEDVQVEGSVPRGSCRVMEKGPAPLSQMAKPAPAKKPPPPSASKFKKR